MSIDEFDEFGG